MEVNLQELNYKDKIIIEENLEFPLEYLKDTEIISLKNVKVVGDITYDLEDNYVINFTLSGSMLIHDALTDEEVMYDFSTIIEENLENSCKSLDLIEFLWHYIVLEIPLRYTVASDSFEIKEDGYQVISEEEYKDNNNPFKDFFKE